jgi:hypothetical protein
MMKKNFGVLSGILIGSFLCASLAWAGVRIDKPKIRFTVAPGGHVSDEIKVENTGREPISVRVYLEDWVYSDQEGGKEFMPKGTTPMSCANWINFNPTDFKLTPAEERVVRFTVSVPEDAGGSHFAVMFFETGGGDMGSKDAEGNDIRIKVYNRLGALFYIESEGAAEKKAEIRGLDLSQRANDFIVDASFFNTGNTDLAGKGTFNVFDAQGYVFLRGTIDDFYTLPGGKASLKASAATANLKPGRYDILLTLEYETGGNLIQEATFEVGADGVISGPSLKEG